MGSHYFLGLILRGVIMMHLMLGGGVEINISAAALADTLGCLTVFHPQSNVDWYYVATVRETSIHHLSLRKVA